LAASAKFVLTQLLNVAFSNLLSTERIDPLRDACLASDHLLNASVDGIIFISLGTATVGVKL